MKNLSIYKKSFAIASVLLITGLLIEFILGGRAVIIPKAPYNIYILLAIATLIIFLHIFFSNHKYINWLSSVPVATGSIITIFIIVLIMGFVPQIEPTTDKTETVSLLNNIKQSWILAVSSFFMLISLGLTTLRRITPVNRKNTGFVLNHFGLWLIVATASLGSSDILRLRMIVYENQQPEWRAQDHKNSYELPIAIKLEDFDIQEYKPKIAIIDNENNIAEKFKKDIVEISTNKPIKIGNWDIETTLFFKNSVKVAQNYVEFFDKGACPAAYVKISKNTEPIGEQWISSGSYIHGAEVMQLDKKYSLALLKPEPEKFYSKLKLYAKDGTIETQTIQVNKPYKFKGWTIYQLSYDDQKGKWSEYSVLELVRDPWLPVVYVGLFMVLAGSIFLFWSVKTKQ